MFFIGLGDLIFSFINIAKCPKVVTHNVTSVYEVVVFEKRPFQLTTKAK